MNPLIPKNETEYEQQCVVVRWARFQANFGGVEALKMLSASLNGLRLSMGQSVKASKSGMAKGYPDLSIDFPSRGWHGMKIEMKRRKGGRVSKEQKEWIDKLNAHGYYAVVCKGAEEAIREIEFYIGGLV